MKKIVFIEPKNPNVHIFSQFRLPRLGSFILAAIAKSQGWDAEVIVEDYVDLNFEDIASADIVAISTITATAPRAYAIADTVRKRGQTVIMGGPHVTFMVDEALAHCDFVFRGEGEPALANFLSVYESSKDFSMVPNLSFRPKATAEAQIRVRHNASAPYVTDLDTLPIPDFSLMRGKFRCRVGGMNIIPVQTSRGCPFNCSFCSVTGMFGKRYRFRSTESVLKELRQYDAKDNLIFFCDDNFTDNRPRAKELLRAMIAEKFKFKWSTQARTDVAKDPELVELMRKAGCHTLFIGFESISPENLKAMKKGQTIEQSLATIKILRANKIRVHGMFVYGFDGDNKQSIEATIDFAKRSGITSAQFLILTPLPGSKIYEELNTEGRVLFKDWTLYDTHHVVIQPKQLTVAELQWAQVYSHSKFYSTSQLLRRLATGDVIGFGIGIYARGINRKWKRMNRLYTDVLALASPNPIAHIQVNYVEKIDLHA